MFALIFVWLIVPVFVIGSSVSVGVLGRLIHYLSETRAGIKAVNVYVKIPDKIRRAIPGILIASLSIASIVRFGAVFTIFWLLSLVVGCKVIVWFITPPAKTN